MSYPFSRIYRKVARSLRRDGLLETMRLAVRYAKTFTPSHRKQQQARAAIDRAFDERYGVDTGGIVPLESLTIASASQLHGVRYEPIDPDAFHHLMAGAGDVSGHTFIDLGCGKGRALLLAATYPFRRLVGVEFAPQLVEICRQNLRAYSSTNPYRSQAEIVEMDAGEFVFPDDPLVLFLYNPFDGAIASRVADNVRRSWQAHPRPVTILYHQPNFQAIWSALPFLTREPSPPNSAIFRSRIS